MSDIVGSAAIQFEPSGEAEFAAALESQVLAALQAISDQLTTIDGQMSAAASSASDLSSALAGIGVDPIDVEVADIDTVTVDVDTAEATAELDEISTYLQSLPEPPTIDVGVDGTEDAIASLDEVAAAVGALNGADATVAVGVEGGDEAGADLAGIGESVDGIGSKSEQAAGGTTLLAGGIKGIAAAAAGLGAIEFFTGGVQALGRIEEISLQTEARLTATGNAANTTTEDVENLAGALENLTAIEAESIQEGANLILTFKNVRNEAGEGNDIFDRAVETATDLSVVLGTSLMGSSLQLGKALEDPVRGITALRRAGVTFNEEQKATIASLVETGDLLSAQKIILDEVETQVGGAAEAYGQSLPGGLAQAGNKFGEFQEQLASGIVPVLNDLLEIGEEELFPQLLEAAEELTPAIGEMAGAAAELLTAFLPLVADAERAERFADGLAVLADVLGLVADAIETLLDLPGIDEIIDVASILNPVSALGELADGFGEVTGAVDDFFGVDQTSISDLRTTQLVDQLNEATVRAQAEALGLTEAQADVAIGLGRTSDGAFILSDALDHLALSADAAAESGKNFGVVFEGAEKDVRGINEAVVGGARGFAEVIDLVAADAIESLESMGVAAQGTVDIIDAAFKDLNEDGTVSLFEFTTSLQEEVSKQAAFVADIRELQERGADDLALALAQGGVELAGAAAEANALSDEQLAIEEKNIDDTITAHEFLNANIADLNADLVLNADATSKDLEKALRSTDLAGAVEEPILEAQLIAEQGGFLTGEAAAEGFELGLLSKRQALKIAAKEEAQSVIDTWNDVLGVFSPSKVFEEIGEQTIAGFVLGLDGDNAAQSAAEAVASVTPDVGSPGAGAPRGGTFVEINGGVNVYLPNVTDGDPAAIGAAVNEALLRELESAIGAG